ncbi:MAG: nucleotide exchange factor GrpE [Proteobacteria bacterium]|nr:nucleotide exchange factor GrpE [Pseudomonadota bacterium]NBP14838.1 nucleotide exchange factor GrpE [bacterium]
MSNHLDQDGFPELDSEMVQPESDNKEQSDACQVELTAVKEQLVRLGADFQNYKKRIERDKVEWYQTAQTQLLLDLLPVIDDFDRAMQSKQETISPEMAQWVAGFELIYKALTEFLKQRSVVEIDQVKTFDPQLHEALMQVDSPEHTTDEIVQVLQRGFMFNGKVLRPAKVSVAK